MAGIMARRFVNVRTTTKDVTMGLPARRDLSSLPWLCYASVTPPVLLVVRQPGRHLRCARLARARSDG